MPWELYKSDLNTSRMVIVRSRPPLQFDISILPQPPRFKPGSHPPRVDLQLVQDSNAFIVDKIILPFNPFGQPGSGQQRRAYYIIGWPDLPAARPVIDAATILDYVSPRAVEEWEYKDALRREAEKEEAAREEAQAALTNTTGKDMTGVGRIRPGGKRKKPGPKRKQVRVPTPELDSEQEAILARKRNGPSLSTPQKSRILQLEDELDMLEAEDTSEDPDTEIHQQFQNDENITRPIPPDQVNSSAISSKSAPNSTSSLPPYVQQPGPAHAHLSQPQRPVSTTPIPLPPRLILPSHNSKASTPQKTKNGLQSSSRIATPSSQAYPNSDSSSNFTPTNGFTPVGGNIPRPPKRLADSTPKPKKERKKKQAKLSEPQSEPHDEEDTKEQEYVVKRLEGHDFVDGVNYFKVRWEGDWPPDQNPTWEPEENISGDLVKKYLKRKAEREAEKMKNTPRKSTVASSSKPREKQQMTLAHWAKSYNSVAEAFEGKAELDATGAGNNDTGGDITGFGTGGDELDGMDELLVVDTARAEELEKAATERKRRLGLQFAALTPGRRSEF